MEYIWVMRNINDLFDSNKPYDSFEAMQQVANAQMKKGLFVNSGIEMCLDLNGNYTFPTLTL